MAPEPASRRRSASVGPFRRTLDVDRPRVGVEEPEQFVSGTEAEGGGDDLRNRDPERRRTAGGLDRVAHERRHTHAVRHVPRIPPSGIMDRRTNGKPGNGVTNPGRTPPDPRPRLPTYLGRSPARSTLGG